MKNKFLKSSITINKFNILFFTILISLLFSCRTTSSQEFSDDYDNQTSLETTNKVKKEKPQNQTFKYGNKGEYITIGETTIFEKNFFGKFKMEDANLVVRYDDEMRGLGAKYNGQYYFCLFYPKGINMIKDAYKQYLSDFENKKLVRNSKKTLKAYGTTSATLRWGTFSNSTPNNGEGKAQIGYTFINNSPYFTISVPAVYNAHFDVVKDAATRNSNDYKIYMTKAQVSNFLDGLDSKVVDTFLYEVETSSTHSADNY